MLVVLIASLALQASPQGSSAPGVSAPESETAQPAAPARNRQGETLVCRERAPTGSVLRRRVCRSERRTDADRQEAGEYLRDVAPNVPVDPTMPR